MVVLLNENSKLINVIDNVTVEEKGDDVYNTKDKIFELYKKMTESEKKEFKEIVEKYINSINQSLSDRNKNEGDV